MMKTNAGRLPSNATLRMGARPPIQREQSHSEARKHSPTHSPKTRMLRVAVRQCPENHSPAAAAARAAEKIQMAGCLHRSFSEGICAILRVLTSSRHSGPAFIAVSTSSIAENAVPISATAVSTPGFGSCFNDMALRLTD